VLIPSTLRAEAAGTVRVRVATSDGSRYPVQVGAGALADLSDLLLREARAHRYVLMGDDRVMELHGDTVAEAMTPAAVDPPRLTFPAGEAAKSREEWSRLTDQLLELEVGRDGCIVALGGGVSGDLVGFVAATYMRGLPVVQIPTSLVAMVDSSVGGKTGVDVPMGKNLVGAFHPPRFVLADTHLARTLPRVERSQGLAEVVKHGAIADEDYLDQVRDGAEELLQGADELTARVVARSVEIKSWVVSKDEREGSLRQVLNFGHTLGHALEAASDYELPHGSAVALGMVLEARLGEALKITEAGTSEVLVQALEAVELPVDPSTAMEDPDRILAHLSRDKKVRGGRPRFVLLDRIGEVHRGPSSSPAWSHQVPIEAVRDLLEV
jgi:3-dehydroquinate synthase